MIGPLKVLLVEDDPDDELLTREAILRSGAPCEVDSAADGEAALRMAWRPGEAPALILLDLKLPGLGGLEVLRRLRADARTRLVPVVVLTASDEPSDIEAAYSLGANAYLQKSIDFGAAIERLGVTVRFWLTVNLPSQALPR